jgi:hypothetical protein
MIITDAEVEEHERRIDAEWEVKISECGGIDNVPWQWIVAQVFGPPVSNPALREIGL